MEKIDKLFYINLERRPDRNSHFLSECAKINIPNDKIEIYNAIDGQTLTKIDTDMELFKNADYINEHFANNIIGNQLSHFNILKEAVNRNYNCIMVCQDDVIFRDDF
jgi:GR25 family glycosyltransferase involved in LPS biosynthesis